MATTIKLKNGSGAPTTGDLVTGEPALDLVNRRLYSEDAGGAIVEIGSNPSSLSIAGTAVTSTAAELNILDGVTSTAAELNILDGVTSTAAELNILDGVTGIADEDNMASDSATKLATQQSIKAYVDAQVATVDTLAEVLAIGNTTGATDIDVDGAQKVQFRDAAIYINSSVDGQLDIVADTEIQIAATTVDLNGNLDVSGTLGVTGVATLASLVATTADINAGTIDNTVIGGTTAAAGSFTTGAFSGEIAANGGIALGDNDKATFGASDDLQIYHDSGNSLIEESGVGNLIIRGSGNVDIQPSGGGAYMARFAASGASSLYYNGGVKLATTNTGIDVTGTVTATGTSVFASLDISGDIDVDGTANLDVVDIDGAVDFGSTTAHAGDATFADSAKAIFGAGSDLQIYHDGLNSYINDTSGTGNLYVASNQLIINNSPNNENMARFAEDGAVTLYNNGSTKLATTATGIDVTGTVTADGLITNTAGTSNFIAGVNAGNSIIAGGNYNVVVGDEAGTAITTGDDNVAVGYNALITEDTGSRSVAIGSSALKLQNVNGNIFNTAVGYNAGTAVTNGYQNTFIGGLAGTATTTASNNTAIGYASLGANTTGAGNTALGVATLSLGTTGDDNTAIGNNAMSNGVVTGDDNTALGRSAGYNVTSGANNTFLGHDAGYTGSPGGNITTASNEICLGDENVSSANIQVDWTIASDQRDKTDFTALDLGLDFVKALAPVTYKWDKRSKYGDKTAEGYDLNAQTPDGTHKEDWLDIGFKAQEVEALEIAAGYNKDNKTNLVSSHTDDGKQMGLQYSKFVPILVKAIQEQQTLIESLTARLEAVEGK
jgi:hypothetical protein